MTTLVTVVRYRDKTPHPFVHPAEERIGNLLDGAIDHFNARRYLPHALVINGTTQGIDEAVALTDLALEDRRQGRDLRLVEAHEIERPPNVEPHHHVMDTEAMGDCRVCGNVASANVHRVPGDPA